MKANGRESESCLGPVFNFKLGRLVMHAIALHIQARPSLELKTRPRFRPVSISLSMNYSAGPIIHENSLIGSLTSPINETELG